MNDFPFYPALTSVNFKMPKYVYDIESFSFFFDRAVEKSDLCSSPLDSFDTEFSLTNNEVEKNRFFTLNPLMFDPVFCVSAVDS